MQARTAVPITSEGPQRSSSRARLALLGSDGIGAPAGFRAPTPSRRAGRVPAVLCGVAAALLALTAAPALAQSPPTLTDPTASDLGVSAARLNAEVNPSGEAGSPSTYFHFEVSADNGSGEPDGNWIFVNGNPDGVIEGPEAEAAKPIPVEGIAEGLQPATTYFARLAADNAEFTQHSETQPPYPSFTTAAATVPVLTTEAPEAIGYTIATLKGTLNPEGGNVNPTSGPLPIAWELQLSETANPGSWFTVDFGQVEGPEAESSSPIELQAIANPGTLRPGTSYEARIHAFYLNQSREAVAPGPNPTFTTKAAAKPTIENIEVSAITAHTATFSAEVNPNAPEAKPTSADVEAAFRTTWHFQCVPECPGLEGPPVEADNTSHEAPVEATGLTPGLKYEVTLVAENAGGQETAGPVEFTTEAIPPTIDATFATAVSESEATLGAKVNPGGAATTVHFEYLTAEQFKADGEQFGPGTVETEPEPAGSRFPTQLNCTEVEEKNSGCIPDATPTQSVSGLAPDTAYRYRVVATNEKSPSGLPGPTKAFTTTSPSTDFTGACPANEALRRENNSTALPDCRAYEMVSPLDKGGFAAYPKSALPAQISPDGEKIAYLGYASFPGAEGNSALYSAHLGTRASSGWRNTELTPPVPQLKTALRIFLLSYAFSEDLTQTVISVPLAPLTPEATPGVWNLFLRHPGGEYSLLNAATPALSADELCPPVLKPICFLIADISAFAGASADFSHVLFESSAHLTPDAPEQTLENPFTESLYESFEGQVRLVGILPDGHTAANSTAGAGSSAEYATGEQEKDRRVEHAISADGSRVIFSAPSDEGEPNEAGQAAMTEVYDRIEGNETIELSAPNPGATPENPAAAPATFWAASLDGSRVFFTSAAELTTQSKTGEGEDLYEYDFAKPLNERLTDLTAGANPVSGARVLGVVDAADDGSYIYFVAKGQLDGVKGVDGQPNLYMSHEGAAPVFIATLSGSGDCVPSRTFFADSCVWTPFAPALEAYVTPDGRYLAFMSTESLPTANFPAGYDNTDQKTGAPDSQVYEWSAEAGELLCASCDPSGERPQGAALIGGISSTESPREGRASLAGINSPFHRVISLSDNGARLFYTAPVSPAGPRSKVYEYERSGEGSCESPGGCQYLISDPGGEAIEQFLGASADGRDVFFSTVNRLVPGDGDNLIDVYDARERGGFAVTPTTPPCEGEDCAGAASTHPSSPATVTNTFSGREEGPRHPTCAKHQVRRHGRCVSRRHKTKHHRRSHGRHANNNRGGGK